MYSKRKILSHLQTSPFLRQIDNRMIFLNYLTIKDLRGVISSTVSFLPARTRGTFLGQIEMKFSPNPIRSVYWPFMVLILLFPAGCGNLKSENDRLKEEVIDVSAENEKLRKDLTSLKSENSKMYMRVAELHLEISALHQEIQNLKKDLDTFKAQLTAGRRTTRGSSGP